MKFILPKKIKKGDSFNMNRNTGSDWRIDKNALFEMAAANLISYCIATKTSQLFLAKCELEEI